jgi:hypothetical protein
MFEKYLGNRLIERHDKFVVIKPDYEINVVPLECEICSTLLTTVEDEQAYIDFHCCNACALRWAHARKAQWNAGWRPTRDQILEDVSQRTPMIVSIDLDL